MDTPFKLTWGLELEFVVRYDRARYSQYFVSRDGIFWEDGTSLDMNAKLNHLVRADIIQAFKLQKIPVYGILEELSGPERFSKWTVSHDSSIVPNLEQVPGDWAGSSYTGVELKTPIFLYREQAFRQLIQVLYILDNTFSIFVNHSCGLHIHVGNGTTDFPFSTVKNLASLATIFERQFISLHPTHRIHNKYCRPLGQRWHGLDPILIATEIEMFDSIDHLVNKLSDVHGNREKHHAINFCNLINKNGNRTIEFRQHEGTTDPVAMIQWTRLCCEMVLYCHQAGEFGVLYFVHDHAYRAVYSIVDLLTDLGLGGPNGVADYYEQKGLYEHPQQGWHWKCPASEITRPSTIGLPSN
ncbi:MAG: hypothetical protein Q9209_005481 [Squamulea sp. 1 TL-2023]